MGRRRILVMGFCGDGDYVHSPFPVMVMVLVLLPLLLPL